MLILTDDARRRSGRFHSTEIGQARMADLQGECSYVQSTDDVRRRSGGFNVGGVFVRSQHPPRHILEGGARDEREGQDEPVRRRVAPQLETCV